ncbi:resolvase [Gemmatimonadetes bacterium T265]|nr:resolvase [Gemmatimonadetes bacterium T265]
MSTHEQSLALQQDALAKAGCDRTYTDVISGVAVEREGLAAALDYVRSGDTLVVWRLDRLGRSLRHLIEQVTALEARGVGFHSLTEAIDTTTSGGKLVFHIFGALAEFERNVIRERTKAGLAAAKARGRLGGRKRVLSPTQVEAARGLMADPTRPIADVCAAMRVSRATLYRYVPADRRRPALPPPPRAHPLQAVEPLAAPVLVG